MSEVERIMVKTVTAVTYLYNFGMLTKKERERILVRILSHSNGAVLKKDKVQELMRALDAMLLTENVAGDEDPEEVLP